MSKRYRAKLGSPISLKKLTIPTRSDLCKDLFYAGTQKIHFSFPLPCQVSICG